MPRKDPQKSSWVQTLPVAITVSVHVIYMRFVLNPTLVKGLFEWFLFHYYYYYFTILSVWASGLHICLCTVCVHAPGGRKRVSESLELELQTVVIRHVDAKSLTRSFERAVCAPSLQPLRFYFALTF